nr:MAG TPA: hypothetical protein [Caudoviricetes sp.]
MQLTIKYNIINLGIKEFLLNLRIMKKTITLRLIIILKAGIKKFLFILKKLLEDLLLAGNFH